MLSRREYADKLGYKDRHYAYDVFLDEAATLFHAIEQLSPAVADSQRHARDMPNVEYPWHSPSGIEWQAPCDYHFRLGDEIRYEANAKQVLHFLKKLSERFHQIF